MQSERLWQLLARKWSGEATAEELAELEQMLMLFPGEQEKEEVLQAFFLQQTGKQDDNKTKLAWDKHLQRMEQAFPADFRRRKATKNVVTLPRLNKYSSRKVWIAAASFITVIAVVLVKYISYNPASARQPALAEIPVNTVSTGKGDRTKNVLPDGTTVWLNGNSRIEYNENFGKEKRDITLTGEAFFDVAHNPAVPLTVHAKTVNITVKGTAFNVKAYPGETKVEAALVRGSIELSMKKTPDKKILLHPNEKISVDIAAPALYSNKDIQKTDSNSVYVIYNLKPEATSNIIPELSWISNKLVFDNESFESIALKMERWYDVIIEIDNEELKNQKFSGVFEKETVEEALNALQIVYPFRFEIKNRQIFINKREH